MAGDVDYKETWRSPTLRARLKCPKIFRSTKLPPRPDDDYCRAGKRHGVCAFGGWLHGEANHNAEEGTADLEFQAKREDISNERDRNCFKKTGAAHNETLHVLELREPTYDEIRRWVFLSLFPVKAVLNWIASGTEIYPVAGGDPAFLGGADAKLDIFKTSMQILRFFTQSEREAPP